MHTMRSHEKRCCLINGGCLHIIYNRIAPFIKHPCDRYYLTLPEICFHQHIGVKCTPCHLLSELVSKNYTAQTDITAKTSATPHIQNLIIL